MTSLEDESQTHPDSLSCSDMNGPTMSPTTNRKSSSPLADSKKENTIPQNQAARSSLDPTGSKNSPATDAKSHDTSAETNAEWMRRWLKVYPPDFLQEIAKTRTHDIQPGSVGESSSSKRASVYVVLLHSCGHAEAGTIEKQTMHEGKILGVYPTVAAANEHIMVHIAADAEDPLCYYDLPNDNDGGTFWQLGKAPDNYDEDGSVWEVNDAGCLHICTYLPFEGGTLEVYVEKQDPHDIHGPCSDVDVCVAPDDLSSDEVLSGNWSLGF